MSRGSAAISTLVVKRSCESLAVHDLLDRGMRTDVLEHEGLTLGFAVAGKPEHPALVLLHGWPLAKELYDLVVDDLAVDYFVVAFDLPAVGDSRGIPRSAEK